MRELQQELADSLKKQSMSEAFLEVNTRYRNELEEEKSRLFKDLERLRGKVPLNYESKPGLKYRMESAAAADRCHRSETL